MKSKYKKLLLALAVMFLILAGNTLVQAQVAKEVTCPEGETCYIFQVGIPGIAKANEPVTVKGLGTLINKVITLAYRISMLFVLYKIVEIGFKYMTSKGNADVVASVSKGMKNVLIGILILFGSFIILRTINPDLTQLPQNINCPKGSKFCDDKTSTKFTETVVTCPVEKLDERTAEDLENGEGVGSSGSTEDNGVTSSEILKYTSDNSDSIFTSGDWTNAKKDLLSGKTSNNIWTTIKKLIDNKEDWIDKTSCWGKLEFGPIYTGHVKAGDYTSCHETYDAVDLVVRDNIGGATTEKAKSCMRLALNYIKNSIPEVVACDELNCDGTSPHIHIQDKNCTVASCRVCTE